MTAITIPRQVGLVVHDARKARGLTQAQLAQKTGISRQLINRLEMGNADNITLGRLLSVLSVLGCTMSIGREGEIDTGLHTTEERDARAAAAAEVSAQVLASLPQLDESLFSPTA